MDWLKGVNSIKVRTSDLTKDAILVASLSNENG